MNQKEKLEPWEEEVLARWNKPKKSLYALPDSVRDRLAREFKGQILYREPLSRHTSIRIGGPADVFLKPSSLEDLACVLKMAKEEKIPLTFWGLGSNTLVKEGGVRGFVVSLNRTLQEVKILQDHGDEVDIEVQAGLGMTALVNFATENGLKGLQSFIGIPGSVGGAIAMNAGARGSEIKDVVRSVSVMDHEGEIISVPREKLDFSYRHLKIPRSGFVVSAVMRLTKGDREAIGNEVKEYQKKRADTQPLNYPNLGSVFKNPQPHKKNEVVVSAGQMVEEAGLKGIRVGGARISEKHGNFIINEKNATAHDIIVLINLIKDKIRERVGVVLETEIKIIGEEA